MNETAAAAASDGCHYRLVGVGIEGWMGEVRRVQRREQKERETNEQKQKQQERKQKVESRGAVLQQCIMIY